MSRCATTQLLLDAVFAEIDLTRDQAAHLATCSECARAFALLRRFDAALESVGRDLAPERAGSVHDLIDVSIPKGGSTVSWRNGFIGVAAVATVFVVVAAVSLLGDRVGREFGQPIGRSQAAQAFGVPGDAVVMVDGDAVGLRATGEAAGSTRFELLLMAADQRQVRQVYEYTLEFDPNPGAFVQPVRCDGVLERDIYAVIGMVWPADAEQVGIGGVAGDGTTFAVRGQDAEGRVAVLFVAPADEVDDDFRFLLDSGEIEGLGRLGVMGPIEGRGPLSAEEQVAIENAGGPAGQLEGGSVTCAQPATATCADWEQWEAGMRASMTRWLVETRLEAVRVEQQLPQEATDDELVNAAISSIDKNCQLRPAEMRLLEIVERLYD